MKEDFWEVGYTYHGDDGWKFQVDAVTVDPNDGGTVALGWRFFGGEWEICAYYEEDFQLNRPTVTKGKSNE